MTNSRNVGYRKSSAEIVAYIDDDGYAHAGWVASLLPAYEDAGVGGAGGRVLNGQRAEESAGRDRIGVVGPNGVVTGNFAADPGKPIEVDHLIGCSMSFRRSALDRLGGLDERFPGTAMCEDTDICLAVRSQGLRLMFMPGAVVHHMAAPHVKGARFDLRYDYYSHRNLLAMHIRRGAPPALVARYILFASKTRLRSTAGSLLRVGSMMLGVGAGISAGARDRHVNSRGTKGNNGQ